METAPRARLIVACRPRVAVAALLAALACACASPVEEPLLNEVALPPAAAPQPEAPATGDPVPIAPLPTPPVAAEPLPPLQPAEPPQSGPSTPEPASSALPRLECTQKAFRGGAILCLTDPGATVSVNGVAVALADAEGLAVIGLSRTAPTQALVTVTGRPGPDGQPLAASQQIPVGVRSDSVSSFPMECGKISAQTPAQKRHAEISWVKKDKALKTFAPPVAPVGFIKPAEGPYSSPFGVTRTYVPATPDCEGSTSVHNGQDIAIPTGTPIVAPMAGTVILADPDLFYEGGAVFLDLGRGLVSVTMHMSRIDVKAGDVVSQGEVLGLSGATGRVTGPHLHWAIKYRNVHSGDRGTDIWLDPAMVLQLEPDRIPH